MLAQQQPFTNEPSNAPLTWAIESSGKNWKEFLNLLTNFSLAMLIKLQAASCNHRNNVSGIGTKSGLGSWNFI